MPDGARNSWLWQQRNSTRLAFLLQVSAKVLGGLLGLLWSRLLYRALGAPLLGLFSNFQLLASLGGLGDLGLGGAVGIQIGQHLGRGEEEQLRKFLSAARALFVLLALLMGAMFLILSPWLRQWLKFDSLPGAGSMPILFMLGAAAVALLVVNSYVGNLNYACGNVVWPVLPTFLCIQAAYLAQWLLARQHAPLGGQFLPYMMVSAVTLVMVWGFVRQSHRALATFFPLRLDWGLTRGLLERSFWIYLFGLGNAIYTSTDRLLIQVGFSSAEALRYQYNNKLCEFVFFAVVAAGYVSAPKITQWLASPAAKDRARAVAEAGRLSHFQTFLGCVTALGYLFINDLFMRRWYGSELLAPLWWQAAFAANLVITASTDVPMQVTSRLSVRGLRLAGILIGITATLNLGLSFLSMKLGSIGGIALATTLAQTLLSLVLTRYVCRKLETPWLPWMLKTCALPLGVVATATALRFWWPIDSWSHAALLAGSYFVILFAFMRVIGFDAVFLRDEVRRLGLIFKR